jgi:hypothetical protein
MTSEEAISLGILALNTLQHPDATSDADFSEMDDKAEEAIGVLAEVRAGSEVARTLQRIHEVSDEYRVGLGMAMEIVAAEAGVA